MMESVGSEPIDRRQMSGVRGSDSSHVFSKSRITPSAYFSPMESMMYLRAFLLYFYANLQNMVFSCTLVALGNGSVRTPGPDKEKASKTVKGFVIGIWKRFLLRVFLIKPNFPHFLIS